MPSQYDPYALPQAIAGDANPYAPPQSSVDYVATHADIWREGKMLYVARGSDLPARCIKCNAPAVRPVKTRKHYWHHWGWYFLLLFRLLPYLIAYLIVRKRFDLSPGLCKRHNGRRNVLMGLAWAFLALSFGASWFSVSAQEPVALMMALLSLFVALILAAVTSRVVRAVRITTGYAHFKGFGEPFLAAISAENGPLPRRFRT